MRDAFDALNDRVRVEPDEMSPLDERDATLGNEPSHMANVDAKVIRELGDVEQVGNFVTVGRPGSG